MSLTLIAGPEIFPITTEEAKAHLHVDGTEHDIYIQFLIESATEHLDGVGGILGRCLITQTWELSLDEFPSLDCIPIPLAPVQSITSITYIDSDGAPQTFSASNYSLSADRNTVPRVDLAYSASWPSTRNVRDAVTIRFVAGYGDERSSVPQPIRSAMLLFMGHLFNNRAAVDVGVSVAEVPMGFESLVSPYMRFRSV